MTKVNFSELQNHIVSLLKDKELKNSHRTGLPKFQGFWFITTNTYDQTGFGINTVVIRHKNGFSFKVNKADEKDIERMEYVFSINDLLFDEKRGFSDTGCNNPCILSPIAKKVVPSFEKIKKEYPSLTKQRYDFLKENIHDLDEVMDVIHELKTAQ